jgi:ketosteroid isomerase-like protein
VASTRDDVQRLRAIYDGFNAGRLLDPSDVTPDIEFRQPDELGGGEGVYHGPEGFARGVQELLDVFDEFRVVPEQFFVAGPDVVAFVRLQGTAKQSGVPIDAAFAHVVRFRDDRIERFFALADREAAVQQLGVDLEPISD